MMKSKFILTILFAVTLMNFVNSQEMSCGVTAPMQQDADRAAPCFDVEELLANCENGTKIYMRVNLHFFTNDNCEGNIQQTDIKQEDIFLKADEFIEEANKALENNQKQWIVGTTIPCNPLRYMLAGVYIHCRSNAIGGFDVEKLYNEYGINKSTEINYFVADFPGSYNGIGYGTYGSIDGLGIGLINHELGHTFTLDHSWYNELGITDTPNLTYDWDVNCDGDTNDAEDKNDAQCWSFIDGGKTDLNNNGKYDCAEVFPCTPHPCCDWSNINNNVMAYNAYQSAYTPQQINKLLNHIANNSTKCNMIEVIGECAPSKALAGQTPSTLHNENPCNECIYFSGSSNEIKYKYDLYEGIGDGKTCILTKGWTNGEAYKFCYGVGKYGVSNKLKPNTTYNIKLTIENACGEQDEVEYTFTTGGVDCKLEINKVPAFPDPTEGYLRINYNSPISENVNIKAYHALTGNSTTLHDNFPIINGENEIDLDLSSMQDGTYFIIISGNSTFVTSQILKI
ncbi:MAG TPA: hypothetical protein PLC27_08035 [Saprospiraceae bacterium]|nr:hypothetical protein [Saprospiraceae bacterium]